MIDSDDEMYADENTRLDYSESRLVPGVLILFSHDGALVLRLRIISRLRGKEPTPPRDVGPFSANATPTRVPVSAR